MEARGKLVLQKSHLVIIAMPLSFADFFVEVPINLRTESYFLHCLLKAPNLSIITQKYPIVDVPHTTQPRFFCHGSMNYLNMVQINFLEWRCMIEVRGFQSQICNMIFMSEISVKLLSHNHRVNLCITLHYIKQSFFLIWAFPGQFLGFVLAAHLVQTNL